MFFLVTGASGVGKTTAGRILKAGFRDVLASSELTEQGVAPPINLRWRHKAVEKVVQKAVEVQRQGKHYLLCGDPVAVGEVYAAPSADQLEGLAVCLLNVAEEVQRQRLLARGEAPARLPDHVAFAAWLREHTVNPGYRPFVIMQDGWEEMRWERWLKDDEAQAPWRSYLIEATGLNPAEVAARVSAWMHQQLEELT